MKKMTDEIVFKAWRKTLIFMSESTNIPIEELCSKPLDEILNKTDYALSKYVTRLLVAVDLGLVSEADAIKTLAGEHRKVWFPDEEFQREYEKHWNDLVKSSVKWEQWFSQRRRNKHE